MFSSLYKELPGAASLLPGAGRKDAKSDSTALVAARKSVQAYSGSEVHDSTYYAKCMVGGILSCGLTHAAITPLDVVKCRMQTNPEVYTGVFKGFNIISNMPGGLVANGTVGFLPTFIGYSMQGLFKFGLYEIFKDVYAGVVGPENAFNYRTFVFLAASASAEFFADMALCPMEAVKVRMQTSPPEAKFPTDLSAAINKIKSAEGTNGFFKGLTPLWGRQIPYTMVKFAAFERVVEFFYNNVFTAGRENYGKSTQLGITFASGYIAGVFCAIVSPPADTIVSKLNQNSEGGIGAIVKEMGIWNLATKGLGARIFMIGTLTGLQWWIYDTFKVAVGLKTSGGK